MDILLGFTQVFATFIVAMGIFTTPYGVAFAMIGLFIIGVVFIAIPLTMKDNV